MGIEKNKSLALAVSIRGGKTETKIRAKGISKFEVLGLLIFSALSVYEDIKNKNKKV